MFTEETKILVVDDMSTMRKMIKATLRDLGFKNFVEAVDGLEAWEKLNHPEGGELDVIICDWNMPKSTGLDLLKRVRGADQFRKIPFILLTAESEEDQIREAILAGVDNYITKPFAPKTLKEKLAKVFKKRDT